MVNLIVELSKYVLIIWMALFTYRSFRVYKIKSERRKISYLKMQTLYVFGIHFVGFLVLYMKTNDINMISFYLAQVVFLVALIGTYTKAYKNASRLVLNNMCMLLVIGFIVITRISYAKSVRQFKIVILAGIIAALIPLLMSKLKFLKNLKWLYCGAGIISLLVVLVLGQTSYGANISISIAGIGIQPSEFVKIVYVFFVAAMFEKSTDFKQIVITTIFAALHVIVLVLSTDLGGALIFFIAYIAMLYVATKQPFYAATGLVGGSFAAVVAYYLFAHVKRRVTAWKNPWADIEGDGWQIAQSLFAIGTGGWLGMGLYQGMPTSIVFIENDAIFAAIAEELGGIFSICLILVCLSIFIMFMNIASRLASKPFYSYVAVGLGVIYGTQVFLTIGGTIKFIPLTGVTLPLVSYGGSSMLSSMIIFAIIQGLYIIKQNEDDILETDNKEVYRKTKSKGKK